MLRGGADASWGIVEGRPLVGDLADRQAAPLVLPARSALVGVPLWEHALAVVLVLTFRGWVGSGLRAPLFYSWFSAAFACALVPLALLVLVQALTLLWRIGKPTALGGDGKALVVRVDSPGGDAIASDEILHEVKRLSGKKPLVISMSDVAASGGYYIAMSGDPSFVQMLL